MTGRDRLPTSLGGVAPELLDRAFALLLLAFVGTVLLLTPRYSAEGQIFPLVIGVPTLLLLLLLLVIESSSRIDALASRYTSSDLFQLGDLPGEGEESPFARGGVGAGKSRGEARRDVLVFSLWIVALFGVTLLVGLLPGTLLFLLAYYRFYSGRGWSRTLLYSLVTWLFIVVVFDVVLNTPFYTGLFDVQLPLPT